ncbi:hypothetical protein DFJ73DRAFT_763782 [Zopfochytrium polystomum]|nr:hypothetical protein DFJ73DRAFT_763782 [Zopfochytrium polystomum]
MQLDRTRSAALDAFYAYSQLQPQKDEPAGLDNQTNDADAVPDGDWDTEELRLDREWYNQEEADIRPPFVDRKIVFTKQVEPVQIVKDPTADLAVFFRAGSKLVREKREQEERKKAASKFELEGTALDDIMGLAKKDEAEAASGVAVNGESKFSSHLKEKSDAVSAFARSKTMREQREYLPVFAEREELCK